VDPAEPPHRGQLARKALRHFEGDEKASCGLAKVAILDHYAQSLEDISRSGFVAYWTLEFRPYRRAAAVQFAPRHQTMTERLPHKRLGAS